MKFTIAEIAYLVNGKVEGNDSLQISKFNKIEQGETEGITFLANQKYESFLYKTDATAVIVSNDLVLKEKPKATLIYVKNPYIAISTLMTHYKKMVSFSKKGIEKAAVVSETAQIDPLAYIGSLAFVDDNVSIKAHTQIYPQAFIGANVQIGSNTIIYSGVKIYDGCIIGDNCTIHSGAIIGSDGFGFAPKEDGTYQDVPQLGNVIVANNVSIGANSTIDRATMGSTIIGEGSKIDNLVQVAHNVEIGKNTVIAAQTGVSGSTKIGDNCVFAGQVGVAGHIIVEDGTKIGAKSGVTKSILKKGQTYSGHPIARHSDYLKYMIELRNLPKTLKALKS